MDKRRFLKTTLGALLLPPVGPVRAEDRDSLRMAIFPRRNASVTYSMFAPFATHLASQLGREVQLEIFKDFASFWAEFREAKFDIVHFNQYHYLLAREQQGYSVIARNVEFGSDTIAGAIIVRKDSGFEQLSDLKGKNILFGGGPRAMMSYIAPVWLLQQAGLQSDGYRKSFAINPPNALISTFLHRADAAGTGDVAIRLQMVKKIIDTDMMRILASTEQMAHLPWAVHPRIGSTLKKQIQDVMLNLDQSVEGRAMIENMRLTGLSKADDSDYMLVERIIRDVYGDDLGISELS